MAEVYWPLYFARRALVSERMSVRAGDPFPLQGKPQIRGLGPAYGVMDADRRAFHQLPYVRALNVKSEAMGRYILQTGLTYDEAVALLEGKPVPNEATA